MANLTALDVAVGGGNTEAVQLLLDHGADPYIVATTIAARKGRSPEEAEQDELGIGQSYSAYNMAERRVIKPKHVGVVKVLREWKARQDQLGNTRAVSRAVPAAAPSSSHSSDSDSPPRLNGSGSTSPPSTSNSHPKSLSTDAKRLLELKCTPDRAIYHAWKKYPLEVIKELCDEGLTFRDVSADDKFNIFQLFILMSEFEMASYIISKNNNAVNSTNSTGCTTLHL